MKEWEDQAAHGSVSKFLSIDPLVTEGFQPHFQKKSGGP
jgi:hypothetical protein